MAKKWPPSYEMICENTLQSQGKLQKCQQSLTTMHLRREPHAPWDDTHEASHSIFDLLKLSEPMAPAESSSWEDYAI